MTFALLGWYWTHAPLTFNPLLSNVYPAMELLVSEVSVLLKMLDQETLSSSVREKKTSVWNLLQQMQPSGRNVKQKLFKHTRDILGWGNDVHTGLMSGSAKVTEMFFQLYYHVTWEFYSSVFYFLYFLGTDYIYMNSAVYRNGTSFVESLFETFGKFICMHKVNSC